MEKRSRQEFNTVEIVGCIFAAVIIDFGQIVLDFLLVGVALDTVLTIINWVIFRALFWYKGVSKMTVLNVVSGLELIPIINALPLNTLAIIITIVKHNKEVRAAVEAEKEEMAQEAQVMYLKNLSDQEEKAARF